jgi:2'-hydroxyisoflavone reductase
MFLGRHLVDAALSRGHEVTLFNRGRSCPDLFPGLESLAGDRDGGLEPLKGRRWDAVVDTSGRAPRIVRDSARLLADAVEHYAFLSSISVYADRGVRRIGEDAPLAILADESSEDVVADYAPLKARCEREVAAALPGRALIVRAGLIVGPWDYTARFTYWPWRIARGGEVLAPGDPDHPVQFVHARDLADWIVGMAEERRGGTFNATGPKQPTTMGHFLDACRDAVGSDARFTWVDEDFLLEREVIAFTELPLWVPKAIEGMLDVNIDKALAAGLKFRSLAETVRETQAWHDTLPSDADDPGARLYRVEGKAGLTPEREASMLAEWHARQAIKS